MLTENMGEFLEKNKMNVTAEIKENLRIIMKRDYYEGA